MSKARYITNGVRALLGIVSSKRVFTGPSTVYLELSNRCNTNCIMCPDHSPLLTNSKDASSIEQDSTGSHQMDFMDPALLETIIQESREMGVSRIILSGNGEPAIHPLFDSIVDRIVELGLKPYIHTNGIGVDEERAELWANKRAYFRFSLHAGDTETWLRVHPRGTPEQFERLSRIINILVQTRTARVSIIHILQKANFQHVREMIEYAWELGVREVQFEPVRANGDLSQVVLTQDEEIELRQELQHCLQRAKSYNISTNLKDYLESNLYIHSGLRRTAYLYRRIPCIIGWIHTEFGIDGTMIPCEGSSIVLGRAGVQTFREMWHSQRYWDFRRLARNMPRSGQLVKGCLCGQCCYPDLNNHVYDLIHFRSTRILQKLVRMLTLN